jgi:hypothetical protein
MVCPLLKYASFCYAEWPSWRDAHLAEREANRVWSEATPPPLAPPHRLTYGQIMALPYTRPDLTPDVLEVYQLAAYRGFCKQPLRGNHWRRNGGVRQPRPRMPT